MANTLRRKMFKLGGRANTHGVGITSGLKMKKGGSVASLGLAGNNPSKKIGPDNKQREAHSPFLSILPFLGVGTRFLPAFGRALGMGGSKGGLEGLKRIILGGQEGAAFGRGFNPVTGTAKNIIVKGAKGKKGTKGYKPPVRKNMNRKEYMDFLRKSDPDKFAKEFGRFGLGKFGRGRQALRALEVGTVPAAGIGAISAAFPEYEQKPETPIRNLADTLFREAPETALNLFAGLPSGALGLLAGQGAAGFFPAQAITSALYDDKKDKVGSSLVDESEAAKTQKEQKDEFAGLSDKAERMAAAITKENNLATLSKAAGDFGAAAMSGADLAQSLQAGTSGIYDELGRRRDLQENIGGMLAQQVFADEATQSAMIAEAAKTGDPAAVNRMQKYFDGYNEGVTNILPIDAKGRPDFALMAKGTVYMDLEGATGGRYFASNADGSDTQPFDSVEDANAFTQS